MAFGEWWELSKAFAKDKQQGVKDMGSAIRMSQLDNNSWDKFMKY